MTTVACHFNVWETGGQANRRAFRYATPTNHVAYLRHASTYTASTYQQLKLLATSVKCLTALTQELTNSKTHNHEKEQHLGTYPKSHRGGNHSSTNGTDYDFVPRLRAALKSPPLMGRLGGVYNHELHGQRTILNDLTALIFQGGFVVVRKIIRIFATECNEIVL